MKKLQFIIIILLAFLSSCKGKEAIKSSNEEVQKTDGEETETTFTQAQLKNVSIKVGKLQSKSLFTQIPCNGILDVPPQNLVSISNLMGGNIKSFLVLQGSEVHKGQILGTIQSTEVIGLQQDYLENESKLVYLNQELERQKDLSQDNSSSKKSFQQIQSDYNSLKAKSLGLEEKLTLMNINPNQIKKGTMMDHVDILSPIDGFITTVNVNVGKYVSPQDVICEIVNLEHIHLELTVFEKDISSIKKGQKVKFYLVNHPEKEYLASIYLINKKISEDRSVRIHAHIEKEDKLLLPNMYISAKIEVGEVSGLVIPSESVVSNGNKFYIFFRKTLDKTSSTFKMVEVQKGISENGMTQISLMENLKGEKSDLDQVVLEGAYNIYSKIFNVEEEE